MESGRTSVFYLKQRVIFPQCTLHFMLNKTELSDSLNSGDKIIAYPIRYYFDMLFFRRRIAVIAEVLSAEEHQGRIRLNLKGLARVKLKKFYGPASADYQVIEPLPVPEDSELIHELRKTAQELIFLINVSESDRLISLLSYLSDPGQMTDFIANYFVVDYKKRYKLLKEIDQVERTIMLIDIMKKLIKTMEKPA